MRISVGILSAPRPEPTVMKCSQAIVDSGFIFIHHATESNNREFVSGCEFDRSPFGFLGNFQNWIQTARDLCEFGHDAILIAEDDALFAPGIYDLLQRDLWPSEHCGCVSLYCPAMSHYKQNENGLHRTEVIRREPLSTSSNLVGALALVFPREVLLKLAWHPSIDEWKGSHHQARDPKTKPYERKAVDTWIGRTLISMGKQIWHYAPSLVQHYCPDPSKANSSLGHGLANGNRKARLWAGNSNIPLTSLIRQRTQKFEGVQNGQ